MTVSDEGAGLDMSQADRLMRPFERGASARGGVTGTGLGLAIVDRIVRRSDGSCTLENNKPHGHRGKIRLPLADQKAKTAKSV